MDPGGIESRGRTGTRVWRTRLVLALTLLATLVGTGSVARAARPLPRGFFGIVPQGPLLKSDYDRMSGVVGTLRIPVSWSEIEPQAGEYRFAALDETVAGAAAAGVRVLPFVYSTPPWLSADPAHPPIGTPEARRAWSGLLHRLVRRYGPHGAFWQGGQARLPIRRWQIWNEPNYVLFWKPRPSPRGYALLLRISSRAVRAEDPRAQIVTAGVAPVEAGVTPWSFLRRMYRVPGVRRDFDLVGLHPYAPHVVWIAEEIQLVRRAMKDAGDGRKPLLLSEVGVASAGTYPNAFDKGLNGQASFLRRFYRLVLSRRRAWRLAGVDWFTWQDGPAADPHCVFCEFGGLFDVGGAPKPAWWAFRRVVARATSGNRVR